MGVKVDVYHQLVEEQTIFISFIIFSWQLGMVFLGVVAVVDMSTLFNDTQKSQQVDQMSN